MDRPNQPDSMPPQSPSSPLREPEAANPDVLLTLSREESLTLRECSKEALYYRSIPLSAVLGSGTFLAIRYGFLKKSPRLGYLPKLVVASFVGYFLGKYSYREVCAEKLMRLPNSSFGEMLRKRKGLVSLQDTITMESGYNWEGAQEDSSSQEPIFDSHRPDVRDRNEGLDDYQKMKDSLTQYSKDDNAPEEEAKDYTTYQELSKKNREEYASKYEKFEKYRRPPSVDEVSPRSPPPPGSPGSLSPYPPKTSPKYYSPPDASDQKNKYGDTWDD